MAGAGASGDAGAGFFASGFFRKVNLGAFAGVGAFAGGLEENDKIGYPSSPCKKPTSILGVFGGVGLVGAFFSFRCQVYTMTVWKEQLGQPLTGDKKNEDLPTRKASIAPKENK